MFLSGYFIFMKRLVLTKIRTLIKCYQKNVPVALLVQFFIQVILRGKMPDKVLPLTVHNTEVFLWIQ